MTKTELESKVSELLSRVEYLEGALDSMAADGEELGLWKRAQQKRNARAKAEAEKRREQFPIRKEFKKKFTKDREWVESRKKALLEKSVARAGQSKTIAFPITLDHALRVWVENKDNTGERMTIYKQYLRETLLDGKPFKESFNFHANSEPTILASDDTVLKYLAQDRRGKCFDESNWEFFTSRFDMWYLGFQERGRAAKASNAAKSRWQKEK